MTSAGPPDAAARLGIIRIALLAGVLLFGGVIWFLHRQPGYVPAGGMESIRPLIPIVQLAAMAGIVGLRMYSMRMADLRQWPMMQLVGWALGEGAALLGGVYYFNTNDARWYLIGLFVMLASFIVVPLRRS